RYPKTASFGRGSQSVHISDAADEIECDLTSRDQRKRFLPLQKFHHPSDIPPYGRMALAYLTGSSSARLERHLVLPDAVSPGNRRRRGTPAAGRGLCHCRGPEED